MSYSPPGTHRGRLERPQPVEIPSKQQKFSFNLNNIGNETLIF